MELPENYRCGERILDFVKRVFLQNGGVGRGVRAHRRAERARLLGPGGRPGNKGSGFVKYLLLDKGGGTAGAALPEEAGCAPEADDGADGGDAGPAADDGPEKPRIQELVRELTAAAGPTRTSPS